jgi:hypothetical protein
MGIDWVIVQRLFVVRTCVTSVVVEDPDDGDAISEAQSARAS